MNRCCMFNVPVKVMHARIGEAVACRKCGQHWLIIESAESPQGKLAKRADAEITTAPQHGAEVRHGTEDPQLERSMVRSASRIVDHDCIALRL